MPNKVEQKSYEGVEISSERSSIIIIIIADRSTLISLRAIACSMTRRLMICARAFVSDIFTYTCQERSNAEKLSLESVRSFSSLF